MNEKRTGNKGEAVTLAKFVLHGIPCYIPFGDDETADIVADFNGKLQKVQVKTSSYLKGPKKASIEFNITRSYNGTRAAYTADDADYYALYNLVDDELYLIQNDGCRSRGISVRRRGFEPNIKTIRSSEDCLFDNVIEKLK